MAQFIYSKEVDYWHDGFEFALNNYSNINNTILDEKKRGYTQEQIDIVDVKVRKYYDLTLPLVEEAVRRYALFNKYKVATGYEKSRDNNILQYCISLIDRQDIEKGGKSFDEAILSCFQSFIETTSEIVDRDGLIKCLNIGAFPPSLKRKIMDMYDDRYALCEQLRQLGARLVEIVKERIDILQDEIDKTYEEYSQGNSIEKKLRLFLDSSVFDDGEIFKVFPRVSNVNSLSLIKLDSIRGGNVYVGVCTCGLWERQVIDKSNTKRVTRLLKAIGDETRLKIIALLAKSPTYMQKISQTLQLTPATISHHIQMLLDEALIMIDIPTDEKRIYYKLNTGTFDSIAETIKGLTHDDTNQ